ncbi:MAG: hypothetical protein U0175_07410 [Caldilineaceae bacterium]
MDAFAGVAGRHPSFAGSSPVQPLALAALVPIRMMIIPCPSRLYTVAPQRIGLSMYAIGSSNIAARLAGLDVRRAGIASFAVGGAM